MSVLCISFNHTRLPIAVRELLSWDKLKRIEFIQSWIENCQIEGALMLSTCNRVEFYYSAPESVQSVALAYLNESLAHLIDIDLGQRYQEQDCISHLISVACGLDSQSVGETQILGQLKSAYAEAKQQETLDSQLHDMCQFVFHATKRVRHELQLSRHPVSIAGTAVKLMKKIFPHIHDKHILLVGAGQTSQLLGRYLHQLSFRDICVVNRSKLPGEALAQELSGRYESLAKLPGQLAWADVIFICLDNQRSIIGKGMVESALKKRKNKPQLMFDLGMPRNIEPEVAQLDGVYLFDLDHIHNRSKQSHHLRKSKVLRAQKMIQTYVEHYQRQEDIRSVDDLVLHYRNHAGQDMEELVIKAMRKHQTEDTEQVLRWLTQRVRARAMHAPTKLIKYIASRDKKLLTEAFTELEYPNPKNEPTNT